jgi:ATP phosphoribosyltransferase
VQDKLTIAISKGRILEESLPLLQKMDIVLEEDPKISRKLIFETNQPEIRILIIRATDVPTYVDYGAADIGIAGKDVLLEFDSNELYEPLDLGIAKCKLMLAELENANLGSEHNRVATKYTKTTREYFANLGVQVEIIKLYGSMELAPVMGLSDKIVDLVDTGSTLKANGLIATDTICEISSRLIVNKAAMKLKQARVKKIINQLSDLVKA